MTQEFSSAVRHAAFTAIPRLTGRCHPLTLTPSLINLSEPKTISDGAIKDPDSAWFISFTKFSPVFSLPVGLNYEIASGPLYWTHYTLKRNHFGRSPDTSLQPHGLFLPCSTTVCMYTIQPIKLNF